MSGLAMLHVAAVASTLATCAALGWAAASVHALPRPVVGYRGAARSQSLRSIRGFAVAEAVVRQVGGWLSPHLSRRLVASLDGLVARAGHPLGLDGVELIALSAASGAVCGAIGTTLCAVLDARSTWGIAAAALGCAFPLARVSALSESRTKTIDRSLPAAIDLVALCMGAGLDLPGSLRQVVLDTSAPAPLRYEVERVLRELSMGQTRAQALASLAERVPTAAVQELVAATIQADTKGTPLADVLSAQAEMSRMRRSVSAEEAAARAGVMMMLPLVLLLACVLLILLGPFAAGGVGL